MARARVDIDDGDHALEIMTADEVAKLFRVDRKTIYEAAQRGNIPHRRLGRRVLFDRGAVVAWFRQGEDGE